MAAGVTDHLHDLDWILDMVDEAWPKPQRPASDRKQLGPSHGLAEQDAGRW